MSYRLIIRPEAEAELAEAVSWYEGRIPGLGADFLTAVDTVVDSILSHPLQHPVLHRNVRRALMRRFPYQVLYLVEEDVVVVIAIFHGARDPKQWQPRV